MGENMVRKHVQVFFSVALKISITKTSMDSYIFKQEFTQLKYTMLQDNFLLLCGPNQFHFRERNLVLPK